MSANGQLKSSELGEITHATNGERCSLRRDAARAFLAMNAESERRYGVTLRTSSARTAYRPLKDQEYFWALYRSGRGNLAARPGTSNHGLGLAVDLATPQMRQIVDHIGAKYGFAKKWSDAPTEWWHLKWRPGTYTAIGKALDPLAAYPADERRWIRAFDKHPSAKTRAALVRRMTARRKSIWRAAQKDGWSKAARTTRYRSLTART
ncbi:M15 family metallopeptidase [Patulibacter minatonensis]|uniref:M15 family metallopeptidase n=1 Tax=Patulibacter minatonensis TaxID=298163 RepID=UPI00047C6E96|nr:M15 family metallopeptidase [Patulibacter minatonensis]